MHTDYNKEITIRDLRTALARSKYEKCYLTNDEMVKILQEELGDYAQEIAKKILTQ